MFSNGYFCMASKPRSTKSCHFIGAVSDIVKLMTGIFSGLRPTYENTMLKNLCTPNTWHNVRTKSRVNYRWLFNSIAIFQAATSKPLATMSTAIKLAIALSSTNIERHTPLPAAISKPTGPFMLSTQPGMGSFKLGVTEIEEFRWLLQMKSERPSSGVQTTRFSWGLLISWDSLREPGWPEYTYSRVFRGKITW